MYIALGDDGSDTFHVLELKLSYVTLRASAAGIYYQGLVNCDSVLSAAIESHGVVLNTVCMPGLPTAEEGLYTRITGAPECGALFSSGSVFGIFKEGRNNADRGMIKIYANAYLKLTDGTCLMSDLTAGDTCDDEGFDGVAWSMFDVLTQLDQSYNDLTEKEQATIQTFCATWADAIANYGLKNLKPAA